MGTITLTEVTTPPSNVQAVLNTGQTAVTVTWRPPGAGGQAGVDNFDTTDGGWVPSSNWTNPLGDWQWTNNFSPTPYNDIDTYVDTPPQTTHSGTGMWGTVINGGYSNCGGWSYLRKTFNFSGMTNPVLNFWHYMNGYNTWDYGLIKVNGTTVWGSSAAAVFMPWQKLLMPIPLSWKSALSGMPPPLFPMPDGILMMCMWVLPAALPLLEMIFRL